MNGGVVSEQTHLLRRRVQVSQKQVNHFGYLQQPQLQANGDHPTYFLTFVSFSIWLARAAISITSI